MHSSVTLSDWGELMSVLLSIKPHFASLIFDGSKRFEYRRVVFKRPVRKVLLYASAPISKVVGEFEIEGILHGALADLWSETANHAGISREVFDRYFADRAEGYAIRIGSTLRYKTPRCLRQDFGLHPPQSFIYVSSDQCPNGINL